MTKTIISPILLIILSGCALTPDEASNMPMMELCQKMVLTHNSTTRSVAFDALDKRGQLETCRAQADMIEQAHASSQAAMSNFSNQLMNMSNQVNQQQQRAPQTFCNSYGQGPYATMHCWQQ